jgi:hypothetical protein
MDRDHGMVALVIYPECRFGNRLHIVREDEWKQNRLQLY